MAFLDHDDLWVPGKLALQIAAFEREPGLEVCVGRIQSFRRKGAGSGREPVGKPVAGFLTITMLARRRVFDRVGLLDPSRQHSDSAEWFLRAADLKVAVRALPAVLTLHRLHGANHSLLDGEASRREFLHLARSRLRIGGACG